MVSVDNALEIKSLQKDEQGMWKMDAVSSPTVFLCYSYSFSGFIFLHIYNINLSRLEVDSSE